MSDAHKCLLASCTQVAVSSNNLDVEGGNAFAESLKSNTTIKQVCSSFSFARKLQHAQQKCHLFEMSDAHECLLSSRTQVDASSNNLGVEGGKALADCLKSNTTITQVCYAFSCARQLQNARKNQFFLNLLCSQMPPCLMYTGRSIKLWNGHCWCQGLWRCPSRQQDAAAFECLEQQLRESAGGRSGEAEEQRRDVHSDYDS